MSKEIKRVISEATRMVQQQPEWMQNILRYSNRSTNPTPRPTMQPIAAPLYCFSNHDGSMTIAFTTPKGQAELATVHGSSEYVSPLPAKECAALICRAVNSHDAIRRTLERVRAEILRRHPLARGTVDPLCECVALIDAALVEHPQ